MTVVFDTNLAIMLVRPDALVARDSKNQLISHARERVDGLLEQLAADKNKIVIPAPVLAELLVRSDPDDRAGLVGRFSRSAAFRVEAFDQRAAIELADIEKKAIDRGDKRDGVEGPWTKVRFDRQIVAIAIVAGADTIYTDDENLSKHAYKHGLRVVGIGNLPIPAAAAQIPLPYGEPSGRSTDFGEPVEGGSPGA